MKKSLDTFVKIMVVIVGLAYLVSCFYEVFVLEKELVHVIIELIAVFLVKAMDSSNPKDAKLRSKRKKFKKKDEVKVKVCVSSNVLLHCKIECVVKKNLISLFIEERNV